MSKPTKKNWAELIPHAEPADMAAMKAIIADDLNRAEVGQFSMLRAGVGLLCYRALSGHGEWESRLMELCPGKSPRTLQLYMQQARQFADAHGITPEQAWPELSRIDASQVGLLLAGGGGAAPLQLTAGGPQPDAAKKGGKKGKAKTADAPADDAPTFAQMLLDFIQQRKRAKPAAAADARPLTKGERVAAAVAEANRIVNTMADWVADSTWALLPDEEIESCAAGLRAAADKIREEVRKRQQKAS
jgi:hypothetical protein